MARNPRKNHPPKSRSRFRASWRGQLRFGLVSFEVQAVNAEIKENADVHFHLLHEPDRQRIHYAKICPKHGEVPNDEIVEGYEIAKGKYVEFQKDELKALQNEHERTFTLDAFVKPEEIDPIFFDGRMYYLLPAGTSSNEPYGLLEAAMEKKNRWGVGNVIFSGREQIAIVRPRDGVLVMALLNYDAEIRKPADLKSEFTPSQTTPRKLRLAEQLVSEWQESKFDFSDYKDTYREKVKRAIQAKTKGEKLEAPEEEEPAVVNLMEALKRSVAERSTARARHHATGNSSKTRRKSSSGTRRRSRAITAAG